jgi:hypothetical protein
VAFGDSAAPRCEQARVHELLLRLRQFDFALARLGDPGEGLLAGALQTALGDAQRGIRGFEVGVGAQVLAHEFEHAFALQPRFGEHGLRLADRGRCFDVEIGQFFTFAEPEAGAGGDQCRLGAGAAEFEVAPVEFGDDRARFDDVADVHRQRLEPAADLHAEHQVFLGREGSGDGDRSRQRLQPDSQELHCARSRRRLAAASAGRVAAGTQEEGERCEPDPPRPSAPHPATTVRSLTKRSDISSVNCRSGCRTTIQPSPTTTLRQSRRGSPIGVSSIVAT